MDYYHFNELVQKIMEDIIYKKLSFIWGFNSR